MMVQTGPMVEISLPSRSRRCSPRSTASATAMHCGREKQTVALMLMPRYVASSMAGIPARVPGILTIMLGAIWEKRVFGQYLFARPFFWEDVVSMLVLALHTAYLAALFSGALAPRALLLLALAAYASYAVNATQFVLKLRAARKGRSASRRGASATVGAVR